MIFLSLQRCNPQIRGKMHVEHGLCKRSWLMQSQIWQENPLKLLWSDECTEAVISSMTAGVLQECMNVFSFHSWNSAMCAHKVCVLLISVICALNYLSQYLISHWVVMPLLSTLVCPYANKNSIKIGLWNK